MAAAAAATSLATSSRRALPSLLRTCQHTRPMLGATSITAQTTAQTRYSSSFSHLESELTARRIPLTYDYLAPTSSHLLNIALADVLPRAASSSSSSNHADPRILTNTHTAGTLPPSHHLIYFPTTIPGNELLPDGTDPNQTPGEPFVRRMWAGGSVYWNRAAPIPLDGSRAVCVERIRDVAIKGKEGDEKVFVGIERRVGACKSDDESEESIRSRLCRDEESDFGEAGTVERRNIVFMRGRSKEQAKQDIEKAAQKQLPPPKEGADYTHTFTPSERLLFSYSALTYNAHRIHLDPEYCREVEGHKHMLVHGPLSFTLLMTLLRRHLAELGQGEALSSVEYRNLAPLYCNEPLKLCGRKKEEGKWEIWAETPQGGIGVKGTVKTTMLSKDQLDKLVENDLKMLGY